MHQLSILESILLIGLAGTPFCVSRAEAQERPESPTLRPGDRPEILFVASAPSAEKDENGKPAIASLDPVAFLVGDELRDCATAHPPPGEDNVPKLTIQRLNRAYTKVGYIRFGGAARLGEKLKLSNHALTVRMVITSISMDAFNCIRTKVVRPRRMASKERSGLGAMRLCVIQQCAREQTPRSGLSSFNPHLRLLPLGMFVSPPRAYTPGSSGRPNFKLVIPL